MKSLKLKLVVIYLALVFIVMIVSGTFMLTRVKMDETDKLHKDLVRYAEIVEEEIINVYDNPTDIQKFGFSNPVTLSQDLSKMQCNILNAKGELIASTMSLDQNLSSSVITAALNGERTFASEKSYVDVDGLSKKWDELGYPVFDQNGTLKYVIYVRSGTQAILDKLGDMAKTLLITVGLALVLTGLMGVIFSNTVTEPIILLTKKAKDMASGDLNQEIPVNSADEIGQLTMNFNYMAKELNRTIAATESEKNKLSILLHNMTDGVLSYDAGGNLIHANASCQELLDFDDIEAIPFAEMMKLLGADLKSVSLGETTDANKDSTIAIGDKFITASFTPYMNKLGAIEGWVIVLQDVTKMKKLDNMRKEFVANVSHEIRTPLTTIKSYTETLLDGAMAQPELAKGFLKTIDKEADRMAMLVQDLLDLSRFDNKQINLNLEEVDLIELVRQCIKQNEILANKKRQIIEFAPQDEAMWIEVDLSRINQVITNILTNAIKYSPEDTRIKVYMDETDRYYRVYIQDSGIGIPKEDLNHIFERFYRVDKARSREMGGTGLGLAIAKEFMEAHGGKIVVHSEAGKGTLMVLRFNKPARLS